MYDTPIKMLMTVIKKQKTKIYLLLNKINQFGFLHFLSYPKKNNWKKK